MEIYTTEDGCVSKFIHDDGSETAIKVVKSCSNFIREDGGIAVVWVDRNKYSIFISVSTGCPVHCPFCFLTIKDAAFRMLDSDQIVANVQEALVYEIARRPEIKSRYVKLCWMGMGDAAFQFKMVHNVTRRLVEWIMDNQYAVGLDGIDVSTVLPTSLGKCIDTNSWLIALNNWVLTNQHIPLNPQSFRKEQAALSSATEYYNRSPVRLFFSLHSAKEQTRRRMVPVGMCLDDCEVVLSALQAAGVNVMMHQLFVSGLNDTFEEADAIIEWMRKFPNSELRVLRYNTCSTSPYVEWDQVDYVTKRLISSGIDVKVQISAGSEVQAACGQFLVAITNKRKALLK